MDIAESKRNDTVILALAGRLDANNANVLEDKVGALLDAGEQHLVFDLARLDYISSAGLRVLLVAAKRLGAVDGQLGLAGLAPPVREVFDIAGFSSIFSIYPDVASALKQ